MDKEESWKNWLTINKIYISGDWYSNHHLGLLEINDNVRDYFIENVYDLFFRNYFHVFMINNNFPIKYPKLNEPREEVIKEFNDLYVYLQPYYSIFEKIIPWKGEEAEKNIKEYIQ